MNLYIISKSFRKNLSRNISIIIQLTLGSIILILGVANYNHYIHTYNDAKNVIVPNVVNVSIMDSTDRLTQDTSNNQTQPLSPDEEVKLAYSTIKDKPQVEKIGKEAEDGIDYNDKTRKLTGILKCSYKEITLFSYDRKLTEMYNIKVSEGMDFSTYYKSSNSASYIPLIITKKLEKDNPMGCVEDIPYIQDNIPNHRKFKIIGVLDERYPTLFQLYDLNSALPSNGYCCIAGSLYSDRYSSLYAKLKDGLDKAAVKQDWDKSLPKDKEFQLFSLNEMNEETMLPALDTTKYVYYGVIILILSAFGIISTILFSILKRKREFGARIAVGASKKDIEKMIIGEISVLFIISQVISILAALLISSKSKSFLLDWKSMGECLLLILILAIISIIPAFIRVFKMKPVELIHERR